MEITKYKLELQITQLTLSDMAWNEKSKSQKAIGYDTLIAKLKIRQNYNTIRLSNTLFMTYM